MSKYVTARRTRSRFGALCEQARIARNVSQMDVGKAAGYSGSYYSQLVQGNVTPSMDVFLRTCVTLQLDLTWAIHAVARDMEYHELVVKPVITRVEGEPKAQPNHTVHLSVEQIKDNAHRLFRGKNVRIKT